MRRRVKVSLFYWHLLGHFSHQLASILIYILHCKKNIIEFLDSFWTISPWFWKKNSLLIGKTSLYFPERIFSFSILEFSSPKVLSRKFRERFLLRRAAKILDELLGWRISGRNTNWLKKDSVRILGLRISGKASGFERETYSWLERFRSVTSRQAGRLERDWDFFYSVLPLLQAKLTLKLCQ